MIMIKTSSVVLVLMFKLWNSSGAASSNSDVFTTLSDSEATTADSVTEPEVIGCNGAVCDKHASCLNATGELECTCDNGYQGNGVNKCFDINECYVNGQQINEEICGEHGKCTNTQGSFVCDCNAGYYREDSQCYATTLRRDCADIRAQCHTASGIYTIYIGERPRPLLVYCDMTTDSVGWTVFQRRQDGSVDFYLNWADYQKGFGYIEGEFWIGNDNLHLLTSNKRYKLRVELTAFDGSTAFAEFDNFKVASAADKYKLTSIGKYSGTAGDSLTRHVGQQFSTKDQDNDKVSRNCAVDRKGAWWYTDCNDSNLTGFYHKTQTDNWNSVHWWHWKKVSLKRAEMKLTPFV